MTSIQVHSRISGKGCLDRFGDLLVDFTPTWWYSRRVLSYHNIKAPVFPTNQIIPQVCTLEVPFVLKPGPNILIVNLNNIYQYWSTLCDIGFELSRLGHISIWSIVNDLCLKPPPLDTVTLTQPRPRHLCIPHALPLWRYALRYQNEELAKDIQFMPVSATCCLTK